MTRIVIGIDGGGTTTRALCADLNGTPLAYAETGGANPQHNTDAQQQVQTAIKRVVAQANRRIEDIACLVAGIAGLNAPEDQAWAIHHTAVPGIDCPRIHLNDAEVAHAGAFGAGPGIIAIAGTGSMIFAITDSGRHVRNEHFHQYAGAARHLAFYAMQRVLVDQATEQDRRFIDSLLRYWEVADLAELRELVINQPDEDYNEIKRAYGGMAILVTDAAADSPLARSICDQAIQGLATGIRLLGHCFNGPDVPVVLIGSLARCAAIQTPLAALLANKAEKHYTLVEPALAPAAGAILLALRQLGVPIDEMLTRRLR